MEGVRWPMTLGFTSSMSPPGLLSSLSRCARMHLSVVMVNLMWREILSCMGFSIVESQPRWSMSLSL